MKKKKRNYTRTIDLLFLLVLLIAILYAFNNIISSQLLPQRWLLLAAAAALPGLSAQCAEPGMQNIASTDVGDLSQVMPVVNFTHGGTAGALHSADFAVTDVDKAYIAPAKMMALTAYHLLKDGAVLARRTMDGFTPVFTRESYIETVRRQG